jgi:hypothetical protein
LPSSLTEPVKFSITFCVAAVTASRVRSLSLQLPGHWPDKSATRRRQDAHLLPGLTHRGARILGRGVASRIISRHSLIAASSRSSSLTASSSLVGAAWAAPIPAGPRPPHLGGIAGPGQQPVTTSRAAAQLRLMDQ